MKKLLFSSVAVLLTATVFAQPQPHSYEPPKPPSVAERWKHDSIKLQLYVVLPASQINGVKTAFLSFYSEMDALMQASKTTLPTPPAREEVEKVRSKRDLTLKAILNAQQFDRFETFEKEFMPPPPHPPRPQEIPEKV